MELLKQMTDLFPPNETLPLDTVNPQTRTKVVSYFRGLLARLVPDDLCEGSQHMVWQWGHRLNR